MVNLFTNVKESFHPLDLCSLNFRPYKLLHFNLLMNLKSLSYLESF